MMMLLAVRYMMRMSSQKLQFSMYQMSLLMRSSICQSSLVSPR